MKRFRRSHLLIVVIAVVLLIAGGIWWGIAAAQNPSRIFNDMLANNLSTPSVTRVLQQNGGTLNVSQYTQVNFGANPTAHALTIFKQNGGSISTEEISNRTSDFVRYQNIVATAKTSSGKPIDTSSVVGKWAKLTTGSDLSSTVTSGLFDQSLLGVLPIANLQPSRRQDLLNYIHENKVFSFDSSKVKSVTVNGRKAYQYTVNIHPATYIVMMQNFSKLIGATQFNGVDPNSYEQSKDISIVVKIDARSHNLAEVDQASTGQVETYQAFGVVTNTQLPHATLTTQQLTERLGQLH